ncbi:MAG: hypothetical protein NVS3B21_23350 [Acidimicrobiales bacterium]
MLVLLRHGQTRLNAEGRLAGRLDVDLTDTGIRQAAAAAAAILALGHPTAVLASPLRRAVRTAEALGCPVVIDERWIELDYGEYDGRSPQELPPGFWERWRLDTSLVLPGGESIDGLGSRVRQACEDLRDQAADGLVVVVSHVSPIKAAVAWALGVDNGVAWRMHLAPASITRIAVRGDSQSLHGFNETVGLGPDAPR